MQKLVSYFTDGVKSKTLETIGAEVETQFVYNNGEPVSVETSQKMLSFLAKNNWSIVAKNGNLITSLVDKDGNQIFYELGRHNIEVATKKSTTYKVVDVVRGCLDQVYLAGEAVGARPYYSPILEGEEDLLVIPDERDAVWLELDGRSALAPLARTSSVQFTFSVSLKDVTSILNKLGKNIDKFMDDYPQDKIWKQYIEQSSAGYRQDRYGGPLTFASLNDYCEKLVKNDVVKGVSLVPYSSVPDVDMSLYIRSIWWHFRLKRYGESLCIEVRPMPRRADEQFKCQLDKILSIINN